MFQLFRWIFHLVLKDFSVSDNLQFFGNADCCELHVLFFYQLMVHKDWTSLKLDLKYFSGLLFSSFVFIPAFTPLPEVSGISVWILRLSYSFDLAICQHTVFFSWVCHVRLLLCSLGLWGKGGYPFKYFLLQTMGCVCMNTYVYEPCTSTELLGMMTNGCQV